jgi:acyl-CoA reductase-like NAD-dependent aldehyde dehydrogenase
VKKLVQVLRMEAGKDLVLELGGNDVFIILKMPTWKNSLGCCGRMNNNGQCCVAPNGSLQWKQ